MPNSSRRKQSKPQHLPNEEEEGSKGNEVNQTDTSSCPAVGVKDTQEDLYGSKVTGLNLRENGNSNGEDIIVLEKDQDTSATDSLNSIEMSENREKGSLPHDLSVKVKVTDIINTEELESDDITDLEEDSGTDGLVPLYSPPSAEVCDRFCVYCNTVKNSPADLERHLRKHTGERPFHCDKCTKQFKSKRSLQYHQHMAHDKESASGNIAQRYQPLHKRQMEESLSTSPSLAETDMTLRANVETSRMHLEPHSKRQRLDEFVPQTSVYNSAINSGSTDVGFDLRVPKASDGGSTKLFPNENEGQDQAKICNVCTKSFPKQSDLKRHMMCHTGEKPFRCEFCNKPFRAKSNMHYHLKAAHGVGIELSPGLEERFLRMKTRAHMNYLQKNQVTDTPGLYHRDNHIDIDDIEDDSESTDSSIYPNSGFGSELTDAKSQGHYSNTGKEVKSALDLSVSGRNKEVPGDIMAGQSGETIIQTESPFKKSRISIHNETVLVTRLDGLDTVNGQNTSIYKCYLCGKMFHNMSKLQCHLSLHFEKHLVTYECCFCEELFQFKTQLRNHIRRQHSTQLNDKSKGNEENSMSTMPMETHHPTDNQYTCRYCHKHFNKQISLNKHMRLHFWNRNCFCRICGKSFKQYTSLQLHMSRFHWKTIGKTNKSSLRQKVNFFNTYRFKPESHDGVPNNDEPLDLIKGKSHDVRPVNGNVGDYIPNIPLENGDQSDAGTSHHSSENNWPTLAASNMYVNEEGVEIQTAPKKSLIPFRRESSPRHKSPRKSTPNHLKNQTQLTSDNNVPLNFIKSEPTHQDSNNNESVVQNTYVAPENKGLESLPSGYSMNASNHLLMAKALAAHQTLSHLTNTSQPMIFPPNHLPPNLAAMTQMMTLPVSVPTLSTEAVANTSQSPSPASHTSSKSDTSPDDRDFTKEGSGARDSLVGYPRVQWGKDNWTFNMYCPSGTTHSDGRKVSSLSRTHSRLGIVHTPINREAVCKPTMLTDGRTVYKCPFCSKEFVSFSDINRHMDFHEDIRPYKCQYCDYYARTNSQLKVHMMRHQGIREYCCKLCNYKGVTQSDLNRHMKSQIHMLKARNACDYCGEGFVTMKNLDKHLDGNCIVKMQKLNGGLDMPLQESIA